MFRTKIYWYALLFWGRFKTSLFLYVILGLAQIDKNRALGRKEAAKCATIGSRSSDFWDRGQGAPRARNYWTLKSQASGALSDTPMADGQANFQSPNHSESTPKSLPNHLNYSRIIPKSPRIHPHIAPKSLQIISNHFQITNHAQIKP